MRIQDAAHTVFNLLRRIDLTVQVCIYCMFGSLLIYAAMCCGLINWANHLPPHPCEQSPVAAACSDEPVVPPSGHAPSGRQQLTVSK